MDFFVNSSHSAAEYFLLSGVVCMMDGYNSFVSALGSDLLKPGDTNLACYAQLMLKTEK